MDLSFLRSERSDAIQVRTGEGKKEEDGEGRQNTHHGGKKHTQRVEGERKKEEEEEEEGRTRGLSFEVLSCP
eukprot:1623733-Rhodomonas_salina.1